ncbi:MAG: hypothetical protein ABSE28_23175 [Candidatus Sulfotelmatobacter sp.]
MSEKLVSKAFVEFLNTASTHWASNTCLTADQGWYIEIGHSFLKGGLGKSHFPSASTATPFHPSHRMKPNDSEPIQRNLSAHLSDVNQGCRPRILDVPKRIIELWPYVLIFISLTGFVYLFAGAR